MQTEVNAETLQVTSCYHCGADCSADVVREDDHSFCCDGCRLVYSLLKENNLCTYYNLTQAPGHPSEAEKHMEFSVLDRPEIRKKLVRFDDGVRARIIFRVEGMHCSSCIWLLEHLTKIERGIISSNVNFPAREVTVDFKPKDVLPSRIATLLSMMGYTPSINLGDLDRKEERMFDPRVVKIGVAGFCFGNIMLLSFPEYLAPDAMVGHESLARFFAWLSLGLALPSLIYCGSGFFKSAWKTIRYRVLNIDAPIALAIAVTFLRSVYAIAIEGEAGYLDSMSGIIFFMLIGRYFQDRTYERLNFDRDYRSYFPIAVTVKRKSQEESVPVTELAKDDVMYIRANELVPADSVLISDRAYIDYSFVTGESEPALHVKGDEIFAGARQTGGAAEFQVRSAVSSSYLTQLWNNDAVSKRKQETHRTYIDNINKWFSLSLLILAFGGAGVWAFIDSSRSLNVLTSVLIVACPCTLLLAATFTNGSVLRWLGQAKFYLKNADAIERIATADTIIFDKTGTITNSGAGATIQFEGEQLPKEKMEYVIALARQSGHPLSRAIVSAYSQLGNKSALNTVHEIAGGGITGSGDGHQYMLGSAQMAGVSQQTVSSGSAVWVAIDNKVRGKFIVKGSYRQGLAQMISRLKPRYDIALLSGDNDNERETLEPVFGDRMYFRKTPSEKLEYIATLRNKGKKVVMIGDGLNDAGALMAADAGIAVSDNTNSYFPACDAIMDGSIFSRLDRLLNFTRKAAFIVKIAFVISLLYNVAGMWYSLSGQLSPLVAAVLMPASSFSVIIFTTLAVRFTAMRNLSQSEL